MMKPVKITDEMGDGEIRKKDVRNMFIVLGALLVQLFVILEGLAQNFGFTIPMLELQLMLLGAVGLGLIVIDKL
jgi:hypothetical protein